MARYTPLPSVGRPQPRNLRLGDLYLRQGEQRADAEMRSGAIQAALWGNVGKNIGDTVTNLIEAPGRMRETAARTAETEQRTKIGAMQLGEAERQVNERENYDLAVKEGGGSRARTLALLKDRPELQEKAQAHYAKIDGSLKQLMTSAAEGIADFGYTPEAANAALDDLEENGFDPAKLKQFREAFQNPEQIRSIVDRMLGVQSEKPVELNENARLVNPRTGALIAEGNKKPEPQAPNPTEASLAMSAAAGDPNAQKALELIRKNRASTSGPAPDNVLVPIVGPDGKTRYGTRAEARGALVPSSSEKPSSGVQKRVLNFFNRAEQADKELEALEPEIQKMGIGGQARMAMAPNFAQTQLGQSYTAAQRAFTEARLRKDSGAAIPPQEFENDRQTYFAQPGDSKETLEQKRRARAAMLSSLAFESGQALGEYMGSSEDAAALLASYKQRAQKPATVDDVSKDGAPPAAVANPFRRPKG